MTVRAALLALACLLPTVACGGGGGSGGTSLPDFYIVRTTPLSGAFGVDLDQHVIVVFNKPIDTTTFDADTLVLTTLDGEPLAGSVNLDFNGGDRSMRWIPMLDMEPGRLHTCTVSDALRSVNGETLGGPGSFDFVTTAGTLGLPTPDQMQPTLGRLNVGRQGHEGTLLEDGRVLISGGFTLLGATTNRAEVFRETTSSFQELAGRMVVGRASHTATRLSDGRVLLAGGWIEIGPGQNATTATAEIFDPASNTFSPTGNMTTQRADHAALRLPDGRVLLTGGSRLVGTFLEDLDSAEVFDPATGQFSPLAETMTHTRATHGMVDNGLGQFVLGGGSDADLRHDWYDVATGMFEDLGAGASDRGRFGPAMAAFDSGAVVIAGGDLMGTVMYVNTLGQVINTGSGLNRPRSYARAVRIEPDQILVVGGIDYSNGGFIEASCDVIVEGTIGGSNTYGTDVRLGTGMAWHSATVLASGDILFCGGQNEDGGMPNKRDAYVFHVR